MANEPNPEFSRWLSEHAEAIVSQVTAGLRDTLRRDLAVHLQAVAKLSARVSPRTNAAKRRDVSDLLKREPVWSNRRIATRCGVSGMMVATVRRRLEREGVIEPAPVRHGQNGRLQSALRRKSPTDGGGLER